MRVSYISETKNAPRLHESNFEKNIHSKNHAFEAPIVPPLARYARFGGHIFVKRTQIFVPWGGETFDLPKAERAGAKRRGRGGYPPQGFPGIGISSTALHALRPEASADIRKSTYAYVRLCLSTW